MLLSNTLQQQQLCTALHKSRLPKTFGYYLHIPQIIMSEQKSHQGITAPGLSEADQNINNTTEDISNKASGHKANLSNPSMFLSSLHMIPSL